MEMDEIKEHNLLKDNVVKLLEEAKDVFAENFGEDREDNAKAFEELAEKTRDGRFSIIVVGEFSSGKSTLLNALMREKYLDSFSDETTANINYLKSVKDSPNGKQMIRVNYKDGRCETSEDVSFENIQKYVSTKSDEVAATIESVEIFLDSPFLNSGVDLVDSPGLNGTKELHADITKNQIKASHAAIFMFRATQPGSKSDFQTLIDLKKSCKSSIIVVLNRIDEAAKKGEESVEDIVNKLKENFKEMFPNEKIPEVWPISAYKALVARSKMDLDFHEKLKHTQEEKANYLKTSLIEPFENRLMHYITNGEKAKAELLSPVEKVISVINEASNDLITEKETLNGKFSTDDLNEQIDAINTEIKSVKGIIKKKEKDVENAIYDAISNARNTIISDTKDLKNQTLSNLDNETDLSDFENNVNLYVSRINSKYQSVYSDALSLLEIEFRNAVRRNIDGSIAIINKQLHSICSDENQSLIQAIEIDSSHFNANFDLSKYDTEIEEKKAMRKKARDAQYKAEDDQYVLERIESKIKKVENSMESAKEEYKTNLKNEVGEDPGVWMRKERREREIRTKERSIFNPRRWFGNKWKTKIEQYDVDIPDYSLQDHYKKEKGEYDMKHQIRMQELKDKKSKLEEQMIGFLRGSREARKFKIECDELEDEITKLRKERDQKLNEVIKKQLRKAKKYVEEVFSILERNSRNQAIQSLTEKEEELNQLAMQILEGEIKEDLDIRMKKLENLKAKMALAEKDKEQRLQNIEKANAALNALFVKAEALEEKINSIETDKIKEQ